MPRPLLLAITFSIAILHLPTSLAEVGQSKPEKIQCLNLLGVQMVFWWYFLQRRVGLCTSHQLEALATCLVSWLSSSFGRWITLTRRCLTDTHWRLALALINNFLPCSFQHQEDQEEPLMPPTLATRSQCVAKPKIWTKPNPKLFSNTNFFRYRIRFFFCKQNRDVTLCQEQLSRRRVCQPSCWQHR